MKIFIDNREVEIFISKKRKNKNTYLRVKEDLNIYVTTNYWTKEEAILNLVNNNLDSISKMMNSIQQKKKFNNSFYYLGEKFDIIYTNTGDISFIEKRVLINKKLDIDSWLKQKAKVIYKEELDKLYKIFPRNIPYPSLTIRTMKTRWGVCNVKTKRVTLNLELIKRDIKYLDYVIVHELSHLVYPNHSKLFWNLVGEVITDYKILRKELNSYE